MAVTTGAQTLRPGKPRARVRFGSWDAATIVVAAIFAAPVLAVIGLAMAPAKDIAQISRRRPHPELRDAVDADDSRHTT